MYRNNRSFDFGLRGASARRPRFDSDPDGRYDADMERRADPDARLSNRVTSRYTYDYVYGDRGPRHPRNFNAYTGDRPDRVGDPDAYRRPYTTDAGTRTSRGGYRHPGYDAADFGPDYGGRYPDEV